MRSEWTKVELGGLIDTQKGFAFKSSWYTSFGVPIVRVSDFTDNSISINEINYISNDLAEEHIKHQLQFRDILIQTVGSWQSNPASIVGKVVTVPIDLNGALLNQNAVKIIPKSEIDKRFLYYRLKEENFKLHNLNHAQGAANQASITLESIKKFNFKLPPLSTQRKIASILSSYDDLIENNGKRIKLLEEKAQLTYEEWFVKMRFPGYETAKFDAVTGLPEGWEKVKCFDAMEVLSGGTPKTTIEEYWNGDIEFYTPKDACSTAYTDGTEKKVTKFGLEKCNSKLYPKNTVFITARGTVGKVNLASQSMAMNQSCYALKGKDEVTQLFLFDSIKSIVGSFKSAASGGVFDTIIVDTFKFLPFVLPPKNLISDFTELVTPVYESCLIIQNQNRLLKEARDILLPRLMSGMIDVDSITGQVGEEMVMIKNT